jgi:hypothetical protein
VENEETLTLLRRYGVDFAQRFHIGRAQPVAARRHRAPSVHLDLQMADGQWSGPDEGEGAGRYRRAAG